MVARVTPEEVKAICPTDIADVSPFIATAAATVDQHLATKGVGAGLLKQIEKWLAAHFVKIAEPQRTSEKMGDAADAYAVQVGLGLDATTYGQQVRILDYTGTLAALGRRKARVSML